MIGPHLSGTFVDKPNFISISPRIDSNQDVSNRARKGLLRITASISSYLAPDDAYTQATRPPIIESSVHVTLILLITSRMSVQYQFSRFAVSVFDDMFNGKSDLFIIFVNIGKIMSIRTLLG